MFHVEHKKEINYEFKRNHPGGAGLPRKGD